MTMDPQSQALSLSDLRPGDVIFPTITGYAGLLVGAGQVVLGDATPSEWQVRHVAVVTQPGYPGLRPMIVQAMPSGAEEVEITDAHWSRTYPVLRLDLQDRGSLVDLPYKQAERALSVAEAARRYIGVPYSFADYLAIAGRHVLALKPTTRTPFDHYVTASGHMICSQLVDQALTDAGYHVFNDGRIPQDVTPAALYRQLLALPGTVRLR
jgi:hypothetical protein